MKNRLAIGILILTILLGLTGCKQNQPESPSVNKATETGSDTNTASKDKGNSAEKEPKKKPVEITIWHDKEDKVAGVLQAELDKLAPEVKVTLVKKEGLTEALKLVGNDPKAAPDMYFFAHDKIGVYAEMGILAPITDFLPEDVFKNYMDVTVQAATYKGAVYQLPIYYETLLFMYNKAYMKTEEVPKTTEELYNYAKEKTKGERYGFVEQYCTAYYSVPWIHAFGGYLISNSGDLGLEMPETIKALDYHKKFIKFMPGEGDYNTTNIIFMEGLADSIIGGPWLVPSAREKGIDLGFASMPVVDGTGKPLMPYSGTQGIHVLKTAEEAKKDAITKVLTQLTNPEIGIAMAAASGCAPANKLCYEEDSVKKDEMVMMMKATAENAIPMPNIPEMDVMWSITGSMLTTINMRGEDTAKAVKEAQSQAKELIDTMQ